MSASPGHAPSTGPLRCRWRRGRRSRPAPAERRTPSPRCWRECRPAVTPGSATVLEPAGATVSPPAARHHGEQDDLQVSVDNLEDRGFDPSAGGLFVIDGGKPLGGTSLQQLTQSSRRRSSDARRSRCQRRGSSPRKLQPEVKCVVEFWLRKDVGA